ncbi:recombinase family protein [Jiella mangrovi]|uniref:Recombinase family protein n=1 Tax=Jiella mangrovi TaxID=2821407 RepID=A0ABS4BBX1_9HYPH|nr:recombinase family protein [Jiella mangrovi]MBP0614245.1 recombinase family protein [Jiella mangrovi]
MKKIAYIRVSTTEQRPDRQIDGLQDICDELHIETLSAVSKQRPVFDTALQRLEPGDIFVVWDLDRAFRSVIDALTEAEKLRERGVGFQIANLSIDTTSPAGMFVYTIVSALAEFERRTLSQRTKEGLEAARRRGKRLGRPPKISPEQLEKAKEHLKNGVTPSSVASEFGVAPWSLRRALRRGPFANVQLPSEEVDNVDLTRSAKSEIIRKAANLLKESAKS